MQPIYPDNGEGDRAAHPEAVPGRRPESGDEPGAPSRTLEVDGELFAVRPDGSGGTGYTWLTGPNPGYGFGASPAADLTLDAHVANIRGFLAMVDPATGYIEDR